MVPVSFLCQELKARHEVQELARIPSRDSGHQLSLLVVMSKTCFRQCPGGMLLVRFRSHYGLGGKLCRSRSLLAGLSNIDSKSYVSGFCAILPNFYPAWPLWHALFVSFQEIFDTIKGCKIKKNSKTALTIQKLKPDNMPFHEID